MLCFMIYYVIIILHFTFTKNTNEALDEVAPFKTFKIKSQYKFGLSEETKKLIYKRDRTRSSISKATSSEKPLLIKQYKMLRNLINSKIRKESKEFNNARVEKAKDENEVWNVVNDVINPNKENKWSLTIDDKKIEDEEEIAGHFNTYFVEKIKILKEGIDKTNTQTK